MKATLEKIHYDFPWKVTFFNEDGTSSALLFKHLFIAVARMNAWVGAEPYPQ